MHGRKRFTESNVVRNCVVGYLIDEIGAPVPLQTGRIKRVKHTLQCRLRQRPDEIQCRFLECSDRLEDFFCFVQRPSVCPDHAAHFFQVQVFGEGWSWWHSEKREKAIQIIGHRGDQIAIPFHHIRSFAQLVKHGTGIQRIDRMQPERERRDHAKIAAAAAKRPEQLRIFVGTRFHKFAVRQNDICRQ